ncbi:MAG: CHASE3 domain-containing protein, partial [Rhodoferax sp.]|nr:CHASE3 domain-containing protein [Rhodoferax sp.]
MASLASFEIKVLAAFGAAMLVVTGLATTTWKMAADTAEAARLVTRTHAVLDDIASIRTATLQIEYSTQSYRISGDLARLAERDSAIAAREALLGQLKERTADNAHLQAQWEPLRQIINERLALSRKIEQLRKTEGLAAANAFVASAPLQQTRALTYQLLDAMDGEIDQLLEQHTARQLRAQNTLVVGGALVSVLLLVMLTATYVLILRQVHRTAASQRALAESEENLAITLHSIGDAVLATDTKGCITRMN